MPFEVTLGRLPSLHLGIAGTQISSNMGIMSCNTIPIATGTSRGKSLSRGYQIQMWVSEVPRYANGTALDKQHKYIFTRLAKYCISGAALQHL